MTDLTLLAPDELTISETEELAHHESVVDSVIGGINQLSIIGDASLKVIRDKRLYRAQCKTFEDYCQERFGIGRNYVNRRLVFAGIIENLVPRGTKTLPATERQARPLTALPTPELQAEAWSNAQSAAGKDQPSAKEVDAQVKALQARFDKQIEDLNAEKTQLQSSLELLAAEKTTAETNAENWRQQDIAKLKELREKEQLLLTAQSEAATLRNTIAIEAKKLAAAQELELKTQLDSLTLDKADLNQKLKQLKKEQAAAIETGTKSALKAQQDEIDRKEAQLTAIQLKIAAQTAKLDKVNAQDLVYQHFERSVASLKKVVHALTDEFREALDSEAAPFLPSAFAKDFERIAVELEQGAAGLRAYLNQVEIRQLEVLIDE